MNRTMITLLTIWITFGLVACNALSDVSTSHTIEDIVSQGFYVYLLPDELANEMDWFQEVSFESTAHCKQTDTIRRVNPIQVSYHYEDTVLFSVLIYYPYDPIWNENVEHDTVETDFVWTEQPAEYFFQIIRDYT